MSPSFSSSSLALLLPGSDYTAPRPRTASLLSSSGNSPAESTTTESEADRTTETVKAELERISHTFEDAIQNRAFVALEHLSEKYVSPSFQARFDNALISSWSDYVTVVSKWVEKNPRWRKSVLATEADVNEETGHATVYILMEVVGWPVEFKRLVVSVLKWKKLRRWWVCYENTTMRGVDTFKTGAED